MNYYQLQKDVFDHLYQKHQQDKTFTFSVRQVASKDAEKNYFIGTERSNYFSFTCWEALVYYPGSAGDLTQFVFTLKENRCYVKFQYLMSKSAIGEQNAGNLALGRELLKNLEAAGIKVNKADESTKMLYYQVQPNPAGATDNAVILKSLDELYELVAPIVDSSIEITKQKNPQWQANRFSNERFDSLIEKMHQRIAKFASASPKDMEDLPEEEEQIIVSNETNESKMQLNTILYGPPGTGKTYHTINKAVAIANPDFDFKDKSRADIKKEYERLKDEKQIEFITFHQSMTYEDFVEGIKPKEPKEGDTFLKYEVQPGIFKQIVKRASYLPTIQESRFSLTPEEYAQAAFYKISLGNTAITEDEQIYRYSIDNGYIVLGWGGSTNFTDKSEREITAMVPATLDKYEAQAVNYFIHYLKTGDYVIVSYGNLQFRAIGKVTGEYEFKEVQGLEIRQFRKVDWILKDARIPVEELYGKQFQQQTIYKLNKSEIKEDFFVKASVPVKQEVEKKKNYVLIIDEINRGNISQIFGELITLIEEDKRQERDEKVEVTLPYSKEKFCVPSNLFIIGTMNTADRSVEALDTALRRRFVFEEMEPRPELLSPYEVLKELWLVHWTLSEKEFDQVASSLEKSFDVIINLDTHHKLEEIHRETTQEEWQKVNAESAFEDVIVRGDDYIDLYKLLSSINNRLEVLLSKDHKIGHAWLMNVNGLADLQSAFKNKIIPLLQEYFYSNYAKIGLVLGNAFVVQQPVQKGLFAKFKDSQDLLDDYEGKPIYALKNPYELELEDFRSIYE